MRERRGNFGGDFGNESGGEQRDDVGAQNESGLNLFFILCFISLFL